MGNEVEEFMLQVNIPVFFRDLERSAINLARDARNPQPYYPGYSECRGCVNTIFGLGSFLVSPIFCCTKNTRLYELHISMGKSHLSQACKDLTPIVKVGMGAGITTCAALTAHKWIYCS